MSAHGSGGTVLNVSSCSKRSNTSFRRSSAGTTSGNTKAPGCRWRSAPRRWWRASSTWPNSLRLTTPISGALRAPAVERFAESTLIQTRTRDREAPTLGDQFDGQELLGRILILQWTASGRERCSVAACDGMPTCTRRRRARWGKTSISLTLKFRERIETSSLPWRSGMHGSTSKITTFPGSMTESRALIGRRSGGQPLLRWRRERALASPRFSSTSHSSRGDDGDLGVRGDGSSVTSS